jgi:hypothetical protein
MELSIAEILEIRERLALVEKLSEALTSTIEAIDQKILSWVDAIEISTDQT